MAESWVVWAVVEALVLISDRDSGNVAACPTPKKTQATMSKFWSTSDQVG